MYIIIHDLCVYMREHIIVTCPKRCPYSMYSVKSQRIFKTQYCKLLYKYRWKSGLNFVLSQKSSCRCFLLVHLYRDTARFCMSGHVDVIQGAAQPQVIFLRSIFRCTWLYIAACPLNSGHLLSGRRGLGSEPSIDTRCCRAADMLGFANRTATLPVTWQHAVTKISRDKQIASIVVTCSHGCPYSCYCSEWGERHMRKIVHEWIKNLTIFSFGLPMWCAMTGCSC